MAVDLYDATTDDVNGLLAWDLERSANPTVDIVEGWLEVGAAELAARVGDLDDCPEQTEAFRVRARHIVALFAAAMAEDAHYPERAIDRDAGAYSTVLWNRHTALVEALAGDVEACRDGRTAGDRGGAAHSFPDTPLFTRDQRF